MLSVSSVLTLADYHALSVNIEKRHDGSSHFVVSKAFPFLLFCLVLWVLFSKWQQSDWIPHDNKGWWDYFFLMVAFCGTFALPIARFVGYRRIRRHPSFGRPIHITLEPEGVRGRADQGEGFMFWTHILRVETTETHIFLFLDEKHAYIVPKRDFAASDEAQKFGAFAQSRWHEAHSSPTVPPIASPQ